MVDIPEYAGKYAVTKDGKVWSNRRKFDGTRKTAGWKMTGRFLSLTKKANGYLQVGLLLPDGKRKYELVHRVVARVYIGEPEEGMQVNHLNGVKHDNRVENLEWCTGKENKRHALDVLGKGWGETNGRYIHGRRAKPRPVSIT